MICIYKPTLASGAAVGFSRGGGGVSRFKKIEIFVDLFLFQVDQIDFLSYPKALQDPVLPEISAPQAEFRKNRPKKRFLATFLEKFHQKIVFFRRALPPQD